MATEPSAYLARIQTDPNSGSAPTATAFFGQTVTVGSQTFEAPWVSVSWPLESSKTVTLSDGTVLSYSQISEGVTLIAHTEKAAADQAATEAAAAAAAAAAAQATPAA